MVEEQWVALSIGNSRLHWAKFENGTLLRTWDTEHLVRPMEWDGELWIASVVPEQSEFWKTYQNAQWIDLSRVSLPAVYPTLGVDRALALRGAIAKYGAPALVIDCGTAMTLTGADARSHLVGGAILPGLKLQFQALGKSTAALPWLKPAGILPERWARTTDAAIQSGILHTVVSGVSGFVQDWRSRFPDSAIVLTGGDAELLYRFLDDEVSTLKLDQTLIFSGIAQIRNG